jgi:hypothetical protein
LSAVEGARVLRSCRRSRIRFPDFISFDIGELPKGINFVVSDKPFKKRSIAEYVLIRTSGEIFRLHTELS